MNIKKQTLTKKYPIFNRVKTINKRLVKILEHKMFKGFRSIKQSKEFNFQRPKYIDNNYWENKILDPFDDNYNLEYKRKNLSSFFSKDFTNMLQINNYSKKERTSSKIYLKKENKIRPFKPFNTPQNRNKFRKNQNKKNRTKDYTDKYFYFSSNSSLINNDLYNGNKDKKDKLFKTIFCDENEKGLYNDIPIFAIEKIHKIQEKKTKKNMFLPSKEERINDLQFLYKVSHEMPRKKIDYRSKYNIKSATVRRKLNIMKNAIISSLPHTHSIQSTKFNIKNFCLKPNNSAVFTTTIRNNNSNVSSINNNHKKINKENNDLDYKCLLNTKSNRVKSSNVYKSRNFIIDKKRSSSNYRIKKNTTSTIEKETIEVTPKPNYFPSVTRFMNDQIFLNYINLKKNKFEKLKKRMDFEK